MRCCGQAMCEFTFEENSLGNIFAELKNDPQICEFLITTAMTTFSSVNAANLAEPFPGFLLRHQEVRHKTGNLKHINDAREQGTDIRTAAKVDSTNKDLSSAALYLEAIYKAFKQVHELASDAELREVLGIHVEQLRRPQKAPSASKKALEQWEEQARASIADPS